VELSVYIARQPIVDAEGRIIAYELLYRDTEENRTSVTNDLQATARVLVNALNYIGLKALTKGLPAFVKIDAKTLEDDLVYSISPAHFVLELLGNVSIDNATAKRINYLQSKGYRFALGQLDEARLATPAVRSVLTHLAYVKVDLQHDADAEAVVRALEPYPAVLIAERVEDDTTFEAAGKLGIRTFQGYRFAKPLMMKKERVDPASSDILELIYLLKTNASLDTLIEQFNRSPYLTVNLLKFIQLHEQMAPDTVASIEQALILIGRERLAYWLELLVYAYPEEEFEEEPYARQLSQQARQRACLMQTVAKNIKATPKFVEAAYLTGLLSMSEILFQDGFDTLLSQMHIDKNIADALIKRNGDLGQLLQLAIAVEQDDQHAMHAICGQLYLSQEALGNCLIESYRCSAATP
jgi:c-di-GMP phosphodiesterase